MAFKLKSGNTTSFKDMGSSPAKGRETWSTEDDRETTRIHNKKHEDGTWNADHKTLQQQDKEAYEKEAADAARAAGEDIEEVKKAALNKPE